MLDWFKNLYNKTFADEKKVTISERKNVENNDIKTRMSYVYPTNESNHNQYRPPLKRDSKTRSNNRRIKYNRKNLSQKDNVKGVRNQQSTTMKRSFRRTEVPSPIYGFKTRDISPRKLEQEINETPAYIRKREYQVYNQTQDKMDFNLYEDIEQHQHHKVVESETDETVPNVIPFTPGSRKEREKRLNQEQEKSIQNRVSETTNPVPEKNEMERSRYKGQAVEDKPSFSNRGEQSKSPYNVLMTREDKDKMQTSSSTSNTIPPLHLLDDIPVKTELNEHWIEEQMRRLAKTLKEFNVRAKVSKAVKGPTVTRFEVQPDIGVKVSKITNLSDDIKLNLAAKDIRMEAPIPGKNAIGIEVPNQTRRPVRMLELLKTKEFSEHKSKLAVGLGLDIEGNPIIIDLNKMPHGLIAGATGSGKSVCINTILVSLLYKSSPEDVKFLLVDPKMVELTPYNYMPHLVAPVITDVKAATAALKWAVNEMERRYELFAHESVRDIERYNEKVKEHRITGEKMPYIVIVIDELADLMMVSPQDVEDCINRIAQKARACGIHLILATQRPSVDVITGTIKANVPTRIAFSVSSQVDSKTIIDLSGAEKLLGRGDMLFLENGVGKVKRLQGAYVSDDEIDRVTSFVKKHGAPNYLFEQDDLMQQVSFEEEEDDLLHEAIDLVLDEGKASTSFLQRRFSIGYNRASRLIDRMEEIGLISKQNGSKPRDILLNKEQLDNIFEAPINK